MDSGKQVFLWINPFWTMVNYELAIKEINSLAEELYNTIASHTLSGKSYEYQAAMDYVTRAVHLVRVIYRDADEYSKERDDIVNALNRGPDQRIDSNVDYLTHIRGTLINRVLIHLATAQKFDEAEKQRQETLAQLMFNVSKLSDEKQKLNQDINYSKSEVERLKDELAESRRDAFRNSNDWVNLNEEHKVLQSKLEIAESNYNVVKQERQRTISELNAKIEGMEEQERLHNEIDTHLSTYDKPMTVYVDGKLKGWLTIISCAFLSYLAFTLPGLLGYKVSLIKVLVFEISLITTGFVLHFGSKIKEHIYWLLAFLAGMLIAYFTLPEIVI